MTSPFAPPPRIVAVTGPGLARAAGFAPFDPQVLDRDIALEDVVTRDGFARDPERVHAFYNRCRRQLHGLAPTPAHEALAALAIARRDELLVVARTIDDLHERAGTRAVVHTMGELLKARCLICTRVSDRFDDMTGASDCPVCGNSGHLRPHVVWVGEEPLRMDAVYAALATCQLFAAIGISAAAEPVAGFLADAKRAGARTVEFSPEPTPASGDFAECRHGALVETVPAWVKAVIAAG